MAQVIKAQAGLVLSLPFKEELRTTAGITYKNTDAIDYLNNKEYRKRYADYRNMNDDLRNLFYTAVDKYSLDIKDGKLDFNDSGIVNKEGLDLNLYTVVNDYFIRGILGNRIVPYDESDKDLYKPDLSRIIASYVFNNEDLDQNSLIEIWEALDEPDPKTGIRKTTNRLKLYAEALRKEADALENNSDYSNTFRHTGWQNDIYANRKTAERLRIHAAEIENLDNPNNTESWYKNAALSNLTPQDVKKFFGLESDISRNLANLNEDNKTTSTPSTNEADNENYLPDGYNNVDPLSTKDIEIVLGGKKYTINDSWQKVDNDLVKEMALAILSAYGRQKILHNWTYWRGHKGYLENLTGLFEGRESLDFIGVYSVSPGAIANTGKKFYIRTQNHQYPVEVKLLQNNDGTYIAKDLEGNTYNLGKYNPNNWKSASRALHDTNDVGKPFPFNINLLNQSALAVRLYLLDTILHINPSKFPLLMWANMLMQLSYYFDLKAENGQFEIQIPSNGSKLHLGGERATGKLVASFEWRLGLYGIKFNFNKKGTWIIGKSKNGRQVRYLNPEAIKSVEIIRPSHKLGGKISKLQYGGISDMVNFLQQYGTSYDYQTGYSIENNKNKKEDVTHFNDLSKKLKLASDKDFTVADGIRTAAAGMDLLSAMLMFVPGTNIAGAVGTGISVFGYLTSDIIDGIQGRQKFSDIALNDALLVGTMAVPMFINPLRAKALGMGDKAQRAAKAFSKWFGWAVGAGMIANEETRKSLSNTISKINNGEITKLNSQDATNIAFMVRMAGGVKEGVNARKYNKALKESRITNGKSYVDYSYKDGNEVIQGTPIEVTENTNLSIKSLKEQILNQINEGRTDEAKIKAEDVTIKELDKSTLDKLGEYGRKYYYKLRKKEAPTNQQTDDPLAAIRLELGEETEMSPLYAKIFQKTKFENGKPERTNTAIGRFIRETLGLEDFDVFFSDYSTVKNYRLSKLKRLVENYYKPLDELREQGKKFSNIIKQEGLSEELINLQLVKAMNEYGFLENDPAVIDYARRLAKYYDTDLSRYDNLLLALMALDKEVAASNPIGKTPADPTIYSESLLNTHKLDYVNEASVTPEELQEAYSLFLKEKQKPLTESGTASLIKLLLNTEKPKTNNDNRQLVNKVFSSFNSEAIVPILMDQKLMIKLLLNLPSVRKGLTLGYGQSNPKLSTVNIKKGLLELVDKHIISQEQVDRLIDANAEEKILELINTDPNFYKYLEAAISKSLTNMWNLLKTNPEIAKALKNKTIITEEQFRQAFSDLINSGELTDEALGNFRRSFFTDEIIFNELNNRFNLKAVNKVLSDLTDSKSADRNAYQYFDWLWNKGVRTLTDSNPYEVNGKVFNDILEAFKVPEVVRIKLRQNKQFPDSFKYIYLKAKALLESVNKPIQETPKTELKANTNIKNIFNRNKKVMSENRLNEIKDYIKEETKDTSTSIAVNTRLNQLLDKMKLNGIINEEEYNIIKSKHFNSLKKLIPKHYLGGNIEFVNLVIKLQEGNKIHGILWTSGNQNWGKEVGPKAWKYILNLLKGGNKSLLGYGPGSLYDLGTQYAPLREEYDKNYAKDNYSLLSEAVNKYLLDYFNAMPGYLSEVLGDLYSQGRYTRDGQQITGSLPYEENIYRTRGMAAGTSDLEGLGNINRLTPELISDLLKLLQENWTGGSLYYDKKTGTIFALANGETPQEGTELLSKYNSESKDDSYWEKERKKLFGELYDSKGNFIGLQNPLPGKDTVKGAPINLLRLTSLLKTNLANILAYNELKPKAYKLISPHWVYRLYRNLAKVQEADLEYGPYLNRNISSDMRQNEAFKLNILNAHHKARELGYDLNRTVFKESSEKSSEGVRLDTINAFNVANENRKIEANTENLRKQYKAQQIIANADNDKNLIDTRTAELALDQKIRNAHDLLMKAAMYKDAYNTAITEKRKNVYNAILSSLSSNPKALQAFKQLYPDSTTPFEESEYTPAQYRKWLNEYNEQQKLNMYLNLEQLFDATWDSKRFWHDVSYPFYKQDWSGNPDYQKEKERLEQTKKLGGKIHMAKKGGASINWVRVENARMLNKSIQNDIKHTYESLKEANKEMQRNIRAMAPLIRLLSKTDTVKLK